MIPASGAGGRGFDSPNSPFLVFWCRPERSSRRSRVGARASFVILSSAFGGGAARRRPPLRAPLMVVMTTTSARTFAFLARGGASRASTDAVRAVAARAPSHRRDPIPRAGPPPSTLARAVPRAPAALFSRVYSRAPRSLRLVSLRLRASSDDGAVDAAPAAATEAKKPATHQLITFFCFTEVPDYEAEVAEHRAFVEENGLEIRGRIYINLSHPRAGPP